MNKLTFIQTLSDRLAAIPHGEAQRVLNFYSEAIDDRIEDGMSEEDAVAAVGDPDAIARDILGDAIPTLHRTGDSYKFRIAADEPDGDGRDRAFDPAQVKTILIQETGNDVRVSASPDDRIHVVCEEPRGLVCTLGDDGTLDIRRTAEQHRGSFLGFSFNFSTTVGDDVELLLPEGCRPPLSVATTSGDVEIAVPALEALHIRTTSGDVRIPEGLTVDRTAAVTTVSGDQALFALVCGGDLSVTTTSGDAEMTDPAAKKLTLRTVSGDFDLVGGSVDALNAQSTSGDMDLRLDGVLSQGRFESVSGDYTLHLGGSEELYRVIARDKSGVDRSQGSPSGNPLVFRTLSGDIELSFEE